MKKKSRPGLLYPGLFFVARRLTRYRQVSRAKGTGMKMHHRKRWFLSGGGERDAWFCRSRFYRVEPYTKYFERGARKKKKKKKENSLWTTYGDEGNRGDSLTYFEVGGEKSGWTTIPGGRGVNALSPRFVELFAPLSSTRREGKRAPAFLHPFAPSRSLSEYRATSISGSSVNPPFARLDVSYDFSTIARLHDDFDGSFGLRTRSFYLRPSFIRVICGMSRPRVIYADITCNKWIQRRSRDFIRVLRRIKRILL